MSEEGTPPTEDALPAEDAFGLLANESRMAIVRALATGASETDGRGMSFSELRERAGVRDSGRFNYHLDRLRGRFVRETDDGYALTYAGTLLYRTVVAGFLTRGTEIDPFETGSDCFDCGATLTARYSDGLLWIECRECGRSYHGIEFPPSAAAERSGDELLRAFDQYSRRRVGLAGQGVCPWCAGPMPASFERRPNPGVDDGEGSTLYVTRTCEHCGGFVFSRPGEETLSHPAVVSFFHERGVDITTKPVWEIGFVVTGGATTVLAEDPWRVELSIIHDGDELRLVLDDDATVATVEKP